MIPLTNEENQSYKKQKVSYICKKEFSAYDDDDNENYYKVGDIVILQEHLEDLFIVFVT